MGICSASPGGSPAHCWTYFRVLALIYLGRGCEADAAEHISYNPQTHKSYSHASRYIFCTGSTNMVISHLCKYRTGLSLLLACSTHSWEYPSLWLHLLPNTLQLLYNHSSKADYRKWAQMHKYWFKSGLWKGISWTAAPSLFGSPPAGKNCY